MKKPFILLLLIFVFKINLFSQEKKVGFNIAFNNYNYDYYGDGYFQLEVNYYYRPVKALFRLYTGIGYDKIGISYYDRGVNFNYIKLPIGLNFIFGKKFSFVIGGGFFANILFYSSRGTEKLNNIKKLNLGVATNAGFAYKISDKLSVFLLAQFNKGITPIYYFVGASFYGPYLETDLSLKTGVKYKIN